MDEKNTELQLEAVNHVNSIGKWCMFFAILSIIGAAFMVIGGFSEIVKYFDLRSHPVYHGYFYDIPRSNPTPHLISGLMYITMAGIYVPLIVFLFRISKHSKPAVYSGSNEDAVRFMGNVKSYFKYSGILAIVLISLAVLMIVAFIALDIAK